jgi:hypothetical protein
MMFFGLSLLVDWLIEANVSKKRAIYFFRADNGGSTLLRNVFFYQPFYAAT